MRKLFSVFVVLGLLPMASFADSSAMECRNEVFQYECKFEGRPTCADCDNEKIECFAEGRFRLEHSGPSGSNHERREDPIVVKCSNGFRFFSRDTAVSREDNTLWINGEDGRELLTLKIEDFGRPHKVLSENNHEFLRKADLLFSSRWGEAQRIGGICKIRERDRDVAALLQ